MKLQWYLWITSIKQVIFQYSRKKAHLLSHYSNSKQMLFERITKWIILCLLNNAIQWLPVSRCSKQAWIYVYLKLRVSGCLRRRMRQFSDFPEYRIPIIELNQQVLPANSLHTDRGKSEHQSKKIEPQDTTILRRFIGKCDSKIIQWNLNFTQCMLLHAVMRACWTQECCCCCCHSPSKLMTSNDCETISRMHTTRSLHVSSSLYDHVTCLIIRFARRKSLSTIMWNKARVSRTLHICMSS